MGHRDNIRESDERNGVLEEHQDRRGRDQDDRPRKRQFSGVTKFKDPNNGKFLIVEFSPDTQEEMDELSDLVLNQRDNPSLDRCLMVCQEARVRARVLVGGQYVGHIFADGTCDQGVQKLL